MADFSGNQLAILGLVLILGLALGMLLAGGGRWKRRAHTLEAENRKLAGERDAASKEHAARYEAASKRIAELEHSHGPIGPGTATAVAGGVRGHDDLTRINGIDRDKEVAINEGGYQRYTDISKMSASDAAALEGRLGLAAGTIDKEDWRGQAKALK